jgi:hypothetical protein
MEQLQSQLFMAVPVTPSAAVSDFGGRKYSTDLSRFAERTDLCRQYSLSAANLSAVSLTQMNCLSAVSCYF